MRAAANRSQSYVSHTDARMFENKHTIEGAQTNKQTHTHTHTHTHKHTDSTHRGGAALRERRVERRAPPPHAEARRRHKVDVCSAHKTSGSPAESQAAVKSPATACSRANRAQWCGAPKKCSGPGTEWQQGRPVPVQMWQRGPIGRTEIYDLDGGRDTCQRVRPSHLSAQQATQHATAKKQTNNRNEQRNVVRFGRPTRTKETMSKQTNKQTNKRNDQRGDNPYREPNEPDEPQGPDDLRP